MPTVSYSITATANDASAASGSIDTTFVAQGNIGGSFYYAGFRFPAVAVPQGATITGATLTLIVGGAFGAGSGTSLGVWKGVASDNAPTWTAANLGTTSSRTVASTTALGSTVVNTPLAHTVTSIIQEIINRAGWASGNALAIAGDPTGAANYCPYYDFNDDPAKVAVLSITYTTSGTPSLSVANAAQLQTVASPTIAAKETITPASAAQLQTAASPTVAAKSAVVPASTVQLQTAGGPTLAARSIVSPDSANQAQTTTSPALAARSSVSPDSAAQMQTAASPTVAASAVANVAVASTAHLQTAGSPAIAPRSVVSPDGVVQAQSATSSILTVRVSITPDGCAQLQVSGSPAISVGATSVSPNSVAQVQVASAPQIAPPFPDLAPGLLSVVPERVRLAYAPERARMTVAPRRTRVLFTKVGQ